MTAFTDTERRVVPRWHEFHETLIGRRELCHSAIDPGRRNRDTKAAQRRLMDPNGELERLKSVWRHRPSPLSAYDLVSTAIVLDRLDEAKDAADLIRDGPDTPDRVRMVLAMDPNGFRDGILADPTLEAGRKIGYLRKVLHQWPRNAICWTQLGLLYSRVGIVEKARRCVEIALSLAPNNRYVLRSACRFFVHVNDASRAAWVLRQSARTPGDPWLLAAEISCSHILGVSSPLLSRGIRVLEREALPARHVTELAASIGTFELENGSERKAKKSFGIGAKSPNGNVKAQLQWLRIGHAHVVPPNASLDDGVDDHEARALGFRVEGDWLGAIASCEEWGSDEFFSERPFCLASYIAIEALGDAERAERILNDGLVANRNDTVLLNNLAIALAMQGRLVESRSTLAAASKKILGSPFEDRVALMATKGLIEYREGNVERGREEYLKAIKVASEHGRRDEARRAAIYMALEELKANTADSTWLSSAVLARVERIKGDGWPEREALLNRVKQALRAKRDSGAYLDHSSVVRLVESIPRD